MADWPANVSDINDLENVVRTFYSYDSHGSATTVINDIPVTSDPETDRLITRTDYTYDLSTGNVTAVDFQKDKPSDRFQHRYTYDAAGRMKFVETSRNGVLWDRDVVYDYNLDGSLRRETIGEDSVQGRDYTYTLLGQLKGINHPTLDSDKDPGGDGAATGPHANVGKDAFGMSFHYHEDDFLRSHNTTASPFNDAEPSMLGVPQPNNAAPYNLYSGYIGGWAYRTQATNGESVLRDGMLLGERFRHDKIGRLRSDTTYSFDGTTWISDGNGGWGSRYVLDQNSNMIHIKRWAMSDLSTHLLIDDATITSGGASSNSLGSVEDEGSSLIANYDQQLRDVNSQDVTYDLKGRLTARTVGAISEEIGYTSYDKQSVYELGANTVRTVYNAFGSPVRTEVETDLAFVNTTFLILGYNENQTATYRASTFDADPSVETISIEGLLRLGLAKVTAQNYVDHTSYRRVGDKRYEVIDHVSSVRAVVSDYLSLDANGATAELTSSADYDVYGAQRPYRTFVKAAGEEYPFAFQAMQVAAGMQSIGTYSTNFRLLDVRTGSWNSRDAVFDARSNAYEALGSIPTMLRDPSGLIVEPDLSKLLRSQMSSVVQSKLFALRAAKAPDAIAEAQRALDVANAEAIKLEAEIKRLEGSPVTYGLGQFLMDQTSDGHWGRTRYDPNRNAVVIDVLHGSASVAPEKIKESIFHEWKHQVQFEDGELILSTTDDKGLISREGELAAYNAGYIRSGQAVEPPFQLVYLDPGDQNEWKIVSDLPSERIERALKNVRFKSTQLIDSEGEVDGFRLTTVFDLSNQMWTKPGLINVLNFYSLQKVNTTLLLKSAVIWYLYDHLDDPLGPR